MKQVRTTRATLMDFIARLDAAFGRSGRLYLIGETSHLFEGWRTWITQIEITAEVASEDRPVFRRVVRDLEERLGVTVLDESPGELIPLPDGFEGRARPAVGPPADGASPDGTSLDHLELYHFDPYSVAFRFIARGDEPDYHIVLTMLEHGWITMDDMNARLSQLLPRFTAENIRQDPAEFRRKYKGLGQMWSAVRPGTTHRPTPV